MSEPWSAGEDGLAIAVRLTPRSSRAGIGPALVEADGSIWLTARVTEPPEGGKANDALLRLVAGALGVPASACRIAAGLSARKKRVHVRGDGAALAQALARLLRQGRTSEG